MAKRKRTKGKKYFYSKIVWNNLHQSQGLESQMISLILKFLGARKLRCQNKTAKLTKVIYA